MPEWVWSMVRPARPPVVSFFASASSWLQLAGGAPRPACCQSVVLMYSARVEASFGSQVNVPL